jgi:hypothetical protein
LSADQGEQIAIGGWQLAFTLQGTLCVIRAGEDKETPQAFSKNGWSKPSGLRKADL